VSESDRPDVHWWYVRRAAAAALRLANNYSLADLRAEWGAYEHNLALSPDQHFEQSPEMREALAHFSSRCREAGLEPHFALDKIEEEYGPRPDPDKMLRPPPGFTS
jgi:hypothetical protein